jgi:hypothetical protein
MASSKLIICSLFAAGRLTSTAPSRACLAAARTFAFAPAAYPWRESGRQAMAWCIGRTEAMNDPVAARRKALAKLRGLEDIDDPESLVVPILIDAILMAESYRGARHEITFLNELTRSVDALIRELNAAEKAREWAEPVNGA